MAGKEGEPSLTRKVAGTGLEVVGAVEMVIGAVKLSLPLAAVGGVVWIIGSWVRNYGK